MVSAYLAESEKTSNIRRRLAYLSISELSWIVAAPKGSSIFDTKRDRKAAQWELLRRQAAAQWELLRRQAFK